MEAFQRSLQGDGMVLAFTIILLWSTLLQRNTCSDNGWQPGKSSEIVRNVLARSSFSRYKPKKPRRLGHAKYQCFDRENPRPCSAHELWSEKCVARRHVADFFFVNPLEGRNYVPSSSDKAHHKDKRSSYKESWKEMTRATFYRRKASSHVCMLPAVSCSSPTLLTLMIAKWFIFHSSRH